METSDVAITAGRHPALRPSEHEERSWLRQHQAPTTPFARVMAFRLTGDLNAATLGAALEAVLRDVPGLDVRYCFDDDGDLRKIPVDGPMSEVTPHPVGSRSEALNALLAEQGRPWDLEQEAPVRFRLFPVGPGEAVFGVLVHRILDGAISWAKVFAVLTRVYGNEPSATVPDAVGASHAMADRPESTGIDWLRRPQSTGTWDFADFSRTSWLEQGLGDRAGGRYGAVLDTAPLLRLTGGDAAPRALLAAATVMFGGYLLQLGGDTDLKITVIEEGVDLGVPLASPNDLRLRLCPDVIPGDAVRRLLAGGEPCAGSTEGYGLVVTWLADPTDFLALPGLAVERLPLPSLDAGADLALGLGLVGQDRLTVDLATGPALSPTVGAFLLERFVAFVNGEEVVLSALTGPGIFTDERRTTPADNDDDLVPIILEEFRLALDTADMGADDDFFDHGGHSLIATRVIGRLLGKHHIEVQFNDLFGSPTAAGLARLARRRPAEEAPPPAPMSADTTADDAPLSLAQQSLWKVYAAFGFGEIFNIPFGLRFLDPVDEHVFERAFLDLLERHPALRTRFLDINGTVRQVVVPVADLGRYKWFWHSHESEGVADRHREAAYRFDLSRELPLRLRFMTDDADGQQVLSLLFHHIVLDEWSVNLLMDELAHAYRIRQSGGVPSWKSAPRPFHAFAARQQAAGLNADHLAYWTARLGDVPKGAPLFGRAEAAPSDAAGGWVEVTLDAATVDGLYAQAKTTGASLFNVVYAAIAAALHCLGAPDDLAIGTSASGRTDAEFFDTIGYFTTVVCHRFRIPADITIAGLITHARDTVNESMPYTDVPIDLVEEVLGHDAMASGGHMFEVFIQLHAKNKLNGALTLDDGRRIAFRQVDPDKSESLLGLQFEVMEETIGGERVIRVLMSYRTDHYDAAQVDAIRRTTSAMFALFATADATEPLASLRPAD